MSTPAPDRRVVTGGGHDLTVWARARESAPQVSAAGLAAALCPGLADHPGESPALVVVAAHPDDETFGLGRLAYAWAGQLGRVTAVLATAGEACVDHVMRRPGDIALRRLAEWRRATALLGVSAQHTLGLPDGRLQSYEDQLVRRLTTLVAAIVDEGLYAGTSAVVLATPWRHDPHPDHQAVGRATARVARTLGLGLVEFGVWMTYWGAPEAVAENGQVLVRVTHDEQADEVWAAACREFVTQVQPLADGVTAVVPPEMLAHHRDQLVLVSPEVAAALAARPSRTLTGGTP